MSVIKTPLNENQIARLSSIAQIDNKIASANHCVVENTVLEKIEIEYANGDTTSIYLPEEDMQVVLNGITVERV